MSKEIIIQIPGFKGGLADDAYESLGAVTYQTTKDLEVFSPTNTLTPHLKLGQDSGCTNTNKLQSVYKASNGTYYFLGNSGTNNQRRLFSTSVLGSSSTIATVDTSGTSNTSPDQNELREIVEFKDYLYFANSTTTMSRFGTLSSGPTYTESWQTGFETMSGTGALLAHEKLGKMFVGHKNKVASFDGTTFTLAALTLSSNWRVKSLTEFGRFVAIGIHDVNESKNSKILIWNGSATAVEDQVDIGDIGLQAIRNVNGVINVLCLSNPNGSTITQICRLYEWSGGPVRLIKELDLLPTVAGGVKIRNSAVDVAKDSIAWTFDAATTNTMNLDNGIYAYGRGSSKYPKVVTLDRVNHVPDVDDVSFTSLRFIDGDVVCTWNDGTNYYLNHIKALNTKSDDGVYRTNIFKIDPYFRGRIVDIKIPHKPNPASCGFTARIKHYGHYPPDTSVPAEDSFTDMTTPQGTGLSTGKSQSTDNATYTIIKTSNFFKECDAAQIEIAFDEVNSTNASSIVFPITIRAQVIEKA